MFHALAIQCGAPRWQALAATGLLICNPCFTFLSFSFMTEIPFLTAMVAAHLAFAKAEGPREQLWLWLAAALAVIGILIRPFAAMAIVGCVGAMLLYDPRLRGTRALGPRVVDPDDGAVRRGAGGMRGAMDLADGAGAEAVGCCSSTKITSATSSACRWRTTCAPECSGRCCTSARCCRRSRYLQIDDAAMAPRRDGRRRNFRGRDHTHVDGPSAAGDARVQLLRRMAQRAGVARQVRIAFRGSGDWQYVFLMLASFGAAGLLTAFGEISGRSAAAPPRS